jgi:hypothetical protein
MNVKLPVTNVRGRIGLFLLLGVLGTGLVRGSNKSRDSNSQLPLSFRPAGGSGGFLAPIYPAIQAKSQKEAVKSKKAGADEGLRQAFERAAYSLEDTGHGTYRGENPAQRLTLEFNEREARLSHPGTGTGSNSPCRPR